MAVCWQRLFREEIGMVRPSVKKDFDVAEWLLVKLDRMRAALLSLIYATWFIASRVSVALFVGWVSITVIWSGFGAWIGGARLYAVLYPTTMLAVPLCALIQCVNWSAPECDESREQALFRNWFGLTTMGVLLAGLLYADLLRSAS